MFLRYIKEVTTSKMKNKNYLLFQIFLLIILSIGQLSLNAQTNQPIVGNPPQKVEDNFILEPAEYHVETWIENLDIPWELIFLSENKALVTERDGQIRLIENDTLQEKPYKIIEQVAHIGEGGLMGMAKHPNYPEQKYLYVMHTYQEDNNIFNRVTRYYDTDTTIEFDKVIVDRIPGSRVHNGGRIAFGPDGMLYITTGDTWQSEIAQDINNLGGKILRLTPEGEIPGIAWHPETGNLFSSEHGPSGEFGLRDKDIINIIVKGGNYGWPLVLGDANIEPYIDPIIMWPVATPPSGITFWNNRLFVATLRSQALIRIDFSLSDDRYEVTSIDRLFAKDWHSGTFGRLRNAVVGPDNALYVLSNNLDGRGSPQEGDDKILRITLK